MKNTRTRVLSFIIVLIMAVGVSTSGITALATETPNNKDTISLNTTEDKIEVFTYLDVFQTYYDLVLERAAEVNKTDVCSFEEFCDKFYYMDMDLMSYTNAVINYNVFGKTECNNIDNEVAQKEYQGISATSSSGDADYVLTYSKDTLNSFLRLGYDYELTPVFAFRRDPIYMGYKYSGLQDGDIIHETATPSDLYIGHTAMIYNKSKSSDYGPYVQTIEAVGSGVTFGFLDDTRMVVFGIKILRVQGATASVVENAKYFCFRQLTKDYLPLIIRLQTSIDSENWYCSEMIYAAYKYSNIDIGVKKNIFGWDVYLQLGCLPGDIYNSYNTYNINVPTIHFDISIVSKTGSTWKIRVTNNYIKNMFISYNTKMCFAIDAINWTLNDIDYTDSIPPGGSVEVFVSENWFATCIAFSFQVGYAINNTNIRKRFITLADNLNKSSLTMNVSKYTVQL